MRQHNISVTSLEEYAPNREFVGRNFNAGEVIQLVLKPLLSSSRPRSSSSSTTTTTTPTRWLPFNYVQMVMMHELAHCAQMNHSKAFWAVRNRYADEMRALWNRGYTGEGLWGRGAHLGSGAWDRRGTAVSGDGLPEHLCGGTYRSSTGRGGGKRRKKDKVGWREQKERRIERRFGRNGQALGDDLAVRRTLETAAAAAKGKKTTTAASSARPRVAGSARGRELRAAAALARFGDQVKADEDAASVKSDCYSSSSDQEDDDDDEVVAVDINGKRLLDGKGKRMVKVCEDEDADDADAQAELRELRRAVVKVEDGDGDGDDEVQILSGPPESARERLKPSNVLAKTSVGNKRETVARRDAKAPSAGPKPFRWEDVPEASTATTTARPRQDKAKPASTTTTTTPKPTPAKQSTLPSLNTTNNTSNNNNTKLICSACSYTNNPTTATPSSATCLICANVLDPSRTPGAWACRATSCSGSAYRNSGDCGVCGVCGLRRGALG